MKTSMKLMVMTLVVAMLLSMSAFAASVSYVENGFVPVLNEAGTEYSVTVSYAASGYAAGDQVTLLVLVDSAKITYSDDAETIPNNVIYIDQQTISATADTDAETAENGSFTFTLSKSSVYGTDGEGNPVGKNVYVKLGATSQNAANEGTYTFTTTGGSEDDDSEVTVDVVNPDAFDGLNVAKVTGADGTKTLTVAGAEVVFVKNGDTPYYFILTTNTITEDDLVWSDTAPVRKYIGDANRDGEVTVLDVTGALNILGGTDTLTTNTEKFLADANCDGDFTILDVTGTLNILGGSVPPIFN